MRISGGQYRGRPLQSSKDLSIRPSSDKLRQAVFNMLAARADISGQLVVDLFCGSGSMGLEALSRGAGYGIFIDNAPKSLGVARRNIQKLELEKSARLIKADARQADKLDIEPFQDNKAGLVLIDPPFDRDMEAPVLEAISKSPWISQEAYIVLETALDEIACPKEIRRVAFKDYGRSKIHLLEFYSP